MRVMEDSSTDGQRRPFSRRRRGQIITGLLAAALALVLGVFYTSAPQVAPDVTFVSLQGEKITTADLRGRVALVNFWATDCVICIKEVPQIVSTYERFRAQGFETIAVAMRYDPPNYVLAYVAKNRLPFTVALDPLGELAQAFGNVRATPTSFLLDRRGNIVWRVAGEPDFAQLHALVEAKLAESVTR